MADKKKKRKPRAFGGELKEAAKREFTFGERTFGAKESLPKIKKDLPKESFEQIRRRIVQARKPRGAALSAEEQRKLSAERRRRRRSK